MYALFSMKIFKFAFLLMVIGSIGVVGYMKIEGWNFLDALYMTVITLTTTGYREVAPMSDQGRIFTIGFLLIGFGTFAYILSVIVKEIVGLELNQMFWRKTMDKKIGSLNGHAIICGYGRMGLSIAKQLREAGQFLVIIESNREREDELVKSGHPFLIGDATTDEVLVDAGIARAKNLISVVTSDSENVFITLSARSLNKEITIISRSYHEGSREKLTKAGANKVVSPYNLGSVKITQSILNPAVDDFLEVVSGDQTIDFQLADIIIGADSSCVGKSLAESDFKEKGIIIVGIRKARGELVYAPPSTEQMEEGDRLIALGSGTGVSKFLADQR